MMSGASLKNPLLLLTAVPGAEGESLQGEALASPRPTMHETASGSIQQRR